MTGINAVSSNSVVVVSFVDDIKMLPMVFYITNCDELDEFERVLYNLSANYDADFGLWQDVKNFSNGTPIADFFLTLVHNPSLNYLAEIYSARFTKSTGRTQKRLVARLNRTRIIK